MEWMFDLICMFFFCLFFSFILIPNDQEKRKSTVKLLVTIVNCDYITVP